MQGVVRHTQRRRHNNQPVATVPSEKSVGLSLTAGAQRLYVLASYYCSWQRRGVAPQTYQTKEQRLFAPNLLHFNKYFNYNKRNTCDGNLRHQETLYLVHPLWSIVTFLRGFECRHLVAL